MRRSVHGDGDWKFHDNLPSLEDRSPESESRIGAARACPDPALRDEGTVSERGVGNRELGVAKREWFWFWVFPYSRFTIPYSLTSARIRATNIRRGREKFKRRGAEPPFDRLRAMSEVEWRA